MKATSHPQVPARVAAFEQIYRERMHGLPIVRNDFQVQAVEFSVWEGRLLGVLITPWFINLILLPGPQDDWAQQQIGSKATWHLPAGGFEFTAASEEQSGPYQSCALFSSLAEFPDQASARRVAQAVVHELLSKPEQPIASTQSTAANQQAARAKLRALSRRDLLRGRLRC